MFSLSQKIGIVGVCTIVFSVIIGFVAFDEILKFGIKDQTALKKKSEIRGIYLKLPFPLDVKIYFFNISNPMEVQNGKTPELKEVGPYCYDEYKEKIDVVDNDAEDSLTYTPYDIFLFNQEKSGTLKQDDYVTILHPLVVGIVNKVTKDSPAFLSIINQALPLLFPNLDSIYLTAKVRDILFDGVEIDCRPTEFAAKAVCSQLKAQSQGIKMSDKNNVYLFSILGPRNATLGKRVKVLRGIVNSKDVGRLLEVDGKTEITLWGAPHCNHFKGTDGWIFPPFLTPEEGIWAYSSDLCRNLQAKYVKNVEYKGLNLRRYEADLGDMAHNEDEKCYCDTPKTCLRKGVFDLTKCLGVPIYVTLPHFLNTDEIYLQQVKGLNPVMEDHVVRLLFEGMSGAPIVARKRIQFNLVVGVNNKITLMKNLPEALHPIFWLEEGAEIEGALLKKVTNIFLLIELVKFSRWLGVVMGIIMMIYACYLYFKNRKVVKITPVHLPETATGELGRERAMSGLNIIKNEGDTKGINPVMSGHEFEKY